MFFEIKRIVLDIILVLGLFLLFYTHDYGNLPASLQLLSFKAMLVSAGILHAHIARKLIFPRVNWQGEVKPNTIIAALFYIIIPLCYTFAG